MNYLTKISILFVFSIISSLIFTKILIYLMPKLGIVDYPSDRRAHKKITPRGAGIALVLVYLIFFPAFEYAAIDKLYYTFFIIQTLIPIALISLIDDIIEIHASIRLIIHITCSFLAILWLVQPYSLFHDELPIYLDIAIATIGLVTFVNIYNFQDGLDGITAVESLHLSLTIIILCILNTDIIPNMGFILATSTILLAFSLVFLCFNWHPAAIFIGDVGSISYGFLFGLCLLMMATASERLFVSTVIASFYYISDGGLTILIRLVKGEKIWQPHLKHFFQIAIKKGKTNHQVITNIVICNLFLMSLSINALFYPIISMALAIIIVTITLIRLTQ